MAPTAPKVSLDGSKWYHLMPLLSTLDALLLTLEALLATWDARLRIFTHFYEGFVNNYTFLLKIHGNTTKIQQIETQVMNIAQKHIKSA